MAMHVSPGVYTKIIDLSEYARNVPSTIGFICIYSEKGRDREFIETNAQDFYMEFGEPNIVYGGKAFGQAMYVASSFLKNSDSLYVIRVTHESATYANLAFTVDMMDDAHPVYPLSFEQVETEAEIRALLSIDLNEETHELQNTGEALTTEQLMGSNYADFQIDPATANLQCPLIIIGKGRGAWYNNFKIGLSPHSNAMLRAQGIYILDIYKRQAEDLWIDIDDDDVYKPKPVWKPTDQLEWNETNCGIDIAYTDEMPDALGGGTHVDAEYADYRECIEEGGYYVPQYEILNSFEVSFDPDQMDSSGDTMFIADIINKYVDDLEAIADNDVCRAICELSNSLDTPIDWSQYFSHLVWEVEPDPGNGIVGVPVYDPFLEIQGINVQLTNSTPMALNNGLDVSATVQGGGEVGQYSDSWEGREQWRNDMLAEFVKAYQGQLKRMKCKDPLNITAGIYVDEVLDTEDFYFSIVLDGGFPTVVKDSIFELVRNLRRDCVGIIDNGDNNSPSRALYARRFYHKYNTYHLALYECYSNIYDMYTGRYIWITPVYHMANLIPYTDSVGEIWWAPAGMNRGTLDTIRVARYSPRLGERDQFYLNQINPIVKFNVGYTVWGQLTTQRRATALQDLNIVRLVLYIKRALEQFCKYYIFELNNSSTWNAISSQISLFLNTIKEKRGLYDFSVSVGATEYEIKNRQVHVNVTLNPTRVIEQIHLNMYIV